MIADIKTASLAEACATCGTRFRLSDAATTGTSSAGKLTEIATLIRPRVKDTASPARHSGDTDEMRSYNFQYFENYIILTSKFPRFRRLHNWHQNFHYWEKYTILSPLFLQLRKLHNFVIFFLQKISTIAKINYYPHFSHFIQ